MRVGQKRDSQPEALKHDKCIPSSRFLPPGRSAVGLVDDNPMGLVHLQQIPGPAPERRALHVPADRRAEVGRGGSVHPVRRRSAGRAPGIAAGRRTLRIIVGRPAPLPTSPFPGRGGMFPGFRSGSAGACPPRDPDGDQVISDPVAEDVQARGRPAFRFCVPTGCRLRSTGVIKTMGPPLRLRDT